MDTGSNRYYVEANMDAYLIGFVVSMLGGKNNEADVPSDHYIGTLLYNMIDRVPEDCRFIPPAHRKKKILRLYFQTLGRNADCRKLVYRHYYFPASKQLEFEKSIRLLFDNLFYETISIVLEYTDEQIKRLIEKFCTRHNIDFTEHSDALIKKYYRDRKKKEADKKTEPTFF